jgi:hypothetical protein
MCKSIWAAIVSTGLLAGTPAMKAQSDPATSQVAQEASQGQDTVTAAEVTKYIDQHQDLVSAILKMYMNYIKQIQTLANDDGTSTTTNVQTISTTPGSGSGSSASEGGTVQEGVVQPSSGVQAGTMQPSSGIQPGTMQPSSGVQAGSVQPSGGLTTGHLAGYPSLPAVDPVSSVKHMSEEQIEYAAKVRKENQESKESLMAQPVGSGN